MSKAFALIRPFLHLLPPETAHNLGLYALQKGLLSPAAQPPVESLHVKAFGLNFVNPVGLAAGFDKNATAINALLGQGFGFVETGTVTPRPQDGNPRPRIFRLSEDRGVINRLGFNNEGLSAYVDHFRRRNKKLGIAGANIGKNKDATDAVSDYVDGLWLVYPFADYITVNISSPNTQGLRALQQREALTELLSALKTAHGECAAVQGRHVPLLLKIAPDLTDADLEDVAGVVMAQGIDGVIIGNTTISRPTLASKHAGETGGLSGKPLMTLSTDRLKRFYQITNGAIPLVGVGGIASAQDAYAKIRAGATLVQLYTALVYQGFSLVREITSGLEILLARDGFTHISQAVGHDAKR